MGESHDPLALAAGTLSQAGQGNSAMLASASASTSTPTSMFTGIGAESGTESGTGTGTDTDTAMDGEDDLASFFGGATTRAKRKTPRRKEATLAAANPSPPGGDTLASASRGSRPTGVPPHCGGGHAAVQGARKERCISISVGERERDYSMLKPAQLLPPEPQVGGTE